RSPANQLLGQLAGPQCSALVDLVRILARKRSPADRHARSVMVDNELLSRKPVVSLRATDGKFPCPVEDEFVRGEGRSCSLQPARLQVSQDLLEQRQEDPMLPLVRQSRNVLDAQDETAPLDLRFTRRHFQGGKDLEI